MTWKKSSYSANNGNCVEVEVLGDEEGPLMVYLRDSKYPERSGLHFSPDEFRKFVKWVSEFDTGSDLLGP